MNGFAQNSEGNSENELLIEFTLEESTNLETELRQLNELVDFYFKNTLLVAAKLASHGLKLTSPTSKMPEELAQEMETLNKTREAILEAFQLYRNEIEELAKINDTRALDNSKFLYDLALVKSFLPRYETPKAEGIISKIFASHEPRHVDELIKREEGLKLFYTDFKVFNAERAQQIAQVYNSIVSAINENMGNIIYQTYTKASKISDIPSEIQFYTSIIRGEEYHQNAAMACKSLF